MPYFQDSFLDLVKSRAPILDVVKQYVSLRRNGNQYWGCCPLHHEKTPSFSVQPDKDNFHCFGCGAGGDVFKFIMEIENMSFVEAVTHLAERYGIPLPEPDPVEFKKEQQRLGIYEVLDKICKYYEGQLYSPIGKNALYYLRNRGLSDETIKTFRLGYAPAGSPIKSMLDLEKVPLDMQKQLGVISFKEGRKPCDLYFDRVMFPIFDVKGRVIAFGGRVIGDGEPKYLNSPETPLFIKHNTLYGLNFAKDEARRTEKIMVVEGYMDVISLYSKGFKHAVASCGTACTPDHIKLLWKYSPEPVCSFDGDGAGIRAANHAAQTVLPLLHGDFSLRFMTLPDDMDPDEYVKAKGVSQFNDFAQNNSRPLCDQLWQMLIDKRDISTPERKAKLEADMNSVIETIADNTVKSYYRRDFKERLWKITGGTVKPKEIKKEEKSNKKDNNKNKQIIVDVPKPNLENVTPKTILALLIYCPSAYSNIIEEIAGYKISDPFLSKCFDFIINSMFNNPEITSSELKAELSNNNLGEVLTIIADQIELLERRSLSSEGFFPEQELYQIIQQTKAHKIEEEKQLLLNKMVGASKEQAEEYWKQYCDLCQSK
ncbi:MAG: DNA primase [Alphaproteobacteria bacterium]|nr:DNA primase [Alphaproteobacteria bacterium]